jgi:ATP adenylyltransferase
MDYLWTPWRYRYIAQDVKSSVCVFCTAASSDLDAETLVVRRGTRNFVILNRYPYTTGHAMVVPYEHTANFAGLDPETTAEMMQLAQRVQCALLETYRPEGFNLGMNLGKMAGAGIAEHLHLHVLPRWTGDTNFMTTVGETRLGPEELSVTYERMRKALGS